MNRWKHDIQHVSKAEIFEYCVMDERWQDFRVSLKGKSTEYKLLALESWKNTRQSRGNSERRCQVQVDNYINALKRGGQLDKEGNVVR